MNTIQEIFNNREIAIGIWVLIAVMILLFLKPTRDFLKTAIPILFCKKFVIFYAVFISFLIAVLYGLNWLGVWNIGLLKDTIFWVLFVELPLFAKTIDKAKYSHFFYTIIKENIALVVIIEFFLNFWTFSLCAELILVPAVIFFSFLYVIFGSEKKYICVKKLFDFLSAIAGLSMVAYAIYNTIKAPLVFFNSETMKSFLLPIILLFLNLPVVYALALYNMYEQICIRLKGKKIEQIKMKLRLFLFCGINLYKVTAVRQNLSQTVMISLIEKDLKANLDKLEDRLLLRIGDNYMKRSKFYIITFIIGIITSVVGVVLLNTDATAKEILTLNFKIDIPNIKELATYILCTMMVFCIFALIFAIGFGKRKYEEISRIKKFVLFELLSAVNRQKTQLQDFIPTDSPEDLYICYIVNVYEIKNACDKVLSAYENILKTWEKESIEQLQLYSTAVVGDIGIDSQHFTEYNVISFSEHFNEKVKSAPQSDKFNSFINILETDMKKYIEKINIVTDDFKNYL